MSSTPAPGMTIGRYELGELLARGASSTVFRATHVTMGGSRAIKLLDPQVSPERRARFQREASVAAHLRSPYTIEVYDADAREDARVPYLVMRMLEGETLEARLCKGPLALHEALLCATHAARALETAHEIGIVHTDVRPAKIFVTRDGADTKFVLLGFKLAAAIVPGRQPHARRGIARTPWTSPEQERGGPIDRRWDVWALASVVGACLAGRAGPGVAQWSRRATAASLEERHATPTALVEDLRRAIAQDGN